MDSWGIISVDKTEIKELKSFQKSLKKKRLLCARIDISRSPFPGGAGGFSNRHCEGSLWPAKQSHQQKIFLRLGRRRKNGFF
jgi:hypothetical protein